MRTELAVFGMHVNMSSRTRRRRFVVTVYSIFAAYLTGSWFIDQWNFATMIWLPVVLLPGTWILTRITLSEPGYLPDERELRWRDRAHVWSHRVVAFGALLIWLCVFQQRQAQFQERPWPVLAVRHPWRIDNLLFVEAVCVLFAAATLPQSLILWFAPDMEAPE